MDHSISPSFHSISPWCRELRSISQSVMQTPTFFIASVIRSTCTQSTGTSNPRTNKLTVSLGPEAWVLKFVGYWWIGASYACVCPRSSFDCLLFGEYFWPVPFSFVSCAYVRSRGKIQGDGRKFLDRFRSYFGSQISSQSLNEVHVYQLQPKSATKGDFYFCLCFESASWRIALNGERSQRSAAN